MPASMGVGNKIVTIEDSERQPCEVWSRVMGYYRPVDSWNIGKRAEFAERVMFDPNKVIYRKEQEVA